MLEGQLWPALRGYWHPVAEARDLTDRPLAVQLLDERLVIFRAGDGIHCFRDLCIHRGTPLSLGWVEDNCLVCAYHGWAYAPDGACVQIPSLPPEQGIPRKARAEKHLCAEHYGLLWVCLDEEPRGPIPEFQEYSDPSFHCYTISDQWQASSARFIENVMDFSHFPWVHEGLLGDRNRARCPSYDVRHTDHTLSYSYDMEAARPAENPPIIHRDYCVTLPFSMYLRQTVPGLGLRVFLFTCCPITAKETKFYQLVARNYALDEPDNAHIDVSVQIVDQDRIIVENQRPEELPLDLSAEIHLKGPDGMAVVYRRMLAELGVE